MRDHPSYTRSRSGSRECRLLLICFGFFKFIVILSILCAGEMHQILSRDKHPSYSAELYSSYINILLGVFYSVCRDLRELRHLVGS